MPDWSIEIWLLVLLPGLLCTMGVLTTMGTVIDDITRIEQLKTDVERLRARYEKHLADMYGKRADQDPS